MVKERKLTRITNDVFRRRPNREVPLSTWPPPTHAFNLVLRLLTFSKVIDVGHVTVSSPLVIGQRGGLSVGLVTNVTCVRLVVGVDNMMLV